MRLACLLPLLLAACATTKDEARVAAVADSATTVVALSSGAVERNPLAGSPATLLVLKLGLVEVAPVSAHKPLAAMWWGAAVNNLAVAAGATNPLAVTLGITAALLDMRR